MNQSQEVKSPCLKQGSELNDFCLNQTKGQKLKALRAHLYPNLPLIPSSPPPTPPPATCAPLRNGVTYLTGDVNKL